jgi:hypothetical protein
MLKLIFRLKEIGEGLYLAGGEGFYSVKNSSQIKGSAEAPKENGNRKRC